MPVETYGAREWLIVLGLAFFVWLCAQPVPVRHYIGRPSPQEKPMIPAPWRATAVETGLERRVEGLGMIPLGRVNDGALVRP